MDGRGEQPVEEAALLAVIASGTSAGQGRGFPDVSSHLGFVVPGTIIQGMLLAGLTTGIAFAADIDGISPAVGR